MLGFVTIKKYATFIVYRHSFVHWRKWMTKKTYTILSCGINCGVFAFLLSSVCFFFFSQADNSFAIINGSHTPSYNSLLWYNMIMRTASISNNYWQNQIPISLTQRLSLFSRLFSSFFFSFCFTFSVACIFSPLVLYLIYFYLLWGFLFFFSLLIFANKHNKKETTRLNRIFDLRHKQINKNIF